MTEKGRPEPKVQSPPAGGRKAYRTPRLEEYGHVAKLTQTGGSTMNEPGNPNSKMCL
jgi:hypothetical protein